MNRRFLAALCAAWMLGGAAGAYAQTPIPPEYFPSYVIGSDAAAFPLGAGDFVTIIQGGAVVKGPGNKFLTTDDPATVIGKQFDCAHNTCLNFPGAGGSAPGGSSGDLQTKSGSGFGAITPGTGVASFLATPAGAVLGSWLANGAAAANLGSYVATEADPVVKAINGLVKSNGSAISAAVAGTDYLSPSGSAASLTGIPMANASGVLGATHGGAGTITGLLKGDGAGNVSAAANGTDFTKVTAITCSGTDKVSAITAAGSVTCSADQGGSGATPNGVLNDILTSSGAGGFGTPITPAAGIATLLATPTSANLRAALTDETGTGAAVFGTSPTLTTPNLGTPSAITLTSATGLPISTGVTGLGTGIATWLGTPSGANLASALTSPYPVSPSLDLLGSTRGSVLYRGAAGWAALGPGTNGQVFTTAGAGADPSWATVTGTGTVTSVALSVPATSIFGVTGSPVTTAGTLALTTTGISGGIPYFSSTSQVASSPALTANALVLGGGAGVAPAVLGSLGTTTTVLHGNASGAPTFGAVANADLATMAAHTHKGNNTGSTGAPLDLTQTQLTAELNIMTGDAGAGGLKGLVPAQATGDAAKFLRGDATWQSVTASAGGSSGQLQYNNSGSLGGATVGTGLDMTAGVLNLSSVTVDKTASGQAILAGDQSKTVLIGAHAYTLNQAGSTGFGSGWSSCLLNTDVGNATLTATTSTFLGASGTTAITIAPGGWACPSSDGTNYPTIAGSFSAGNMIGSGAATTGHVLQANNTGTPLTAATDSGLVAANVVTSTATLTANTLTKGNGTKTVALSTITDAGAGVVVGAATGGPQGVGTINATGLLVNGVAVSTGSGCTTAGAAGSVLTDNGSGGCASNTTLTDLSGIVTATQAFALSGTLTPATLSATNNDYNPTNLATASTLRLTGGGTSATLTGIVGGVDGRLLTLINIDTVPLVLSSADTGSSAANRLLLDANTAIPADGVITLRYDGTSSRWRSLGRTHQTVEFPISIIPGVNPAEAILSYIPRNMIVTGISGKLIAAAGSAATISVRKASSTQLCSAGTDLASTTFNANTTAPANQTLTLSSTLSDIQLATGDVLCLHTTQTTEWTGGAAKLNITVSARAR